MHPKSGSFVRGPFDFDAELGTAAIFGTLYVIHPYAQPQPYFVVTTHSTTKTFATDGVKMLTDIANGSENPHLIRAGYGLLASLLIAPDGLKVHEVEEMKFNRHGDRLILDVNEPRFGLAAGSAISFSPSYRKRVEFYHIGQLADELPA